MSTTDSAPPLEAEDLARARKMTQQILEDWDFTRWNDLLAVDVRLSVKMGSIDVDRVGSLAAVSSVHRNAGTSRAANMAMSPTIPLTKNKQPI